MKSYLRVRIEEFIGMGNGDGDGDSNGNGDGGWHTLLLGCEAIYTCEWRSTLGVCCCEK